MSLFDRIVEQTERDRQKGPLVLLFGLIGVSLLAGVGWIVLLAVRLYADAGNGTDRAAALQAIAAGVSLTANVALLAVTGWYAVLTRGILRQSGPIVAAELRVGWLPVYATGGVITAPLSSIAAGAPDVRFPVRTWAIILRNSGNAATKVNAIAVRCENGVSVRAVGTLAGPCPIFTLDAHSAETVCIDFEMVADAIEVWWKVSGSVSLKIRAEVELGSGLVVCSGWESLPSQ